MQQLEIQYFFPLTEQIRLDLDYTPSEQWIAESQKRLPQWRDERLPQSVLTTGTWTTISNNLGNPSFTINIDAMPITIQSKKKPNIFRRYIYKILGMKWKAE